MLNVPEGWRGPIRTLGIFLAYLASQAGVQALNMVTGFVIIRILNKDDYAAYSIINTLGPTMFMLSDIGISTGIYSIARKVWQDNDQMGALINTGLTLRRRFALCSFLLVGPFLVWTLFHKGVSIETIILLTLATVTGVSFQLSGAIMRMVLELRQHIKSLGKVSLIVAVTRLALVMLFAHFFHLTAFLATFAMTCAIIFETAYIARVVRPQVAWNAPVNREYLPIVYAKVRQTMPLTIYYCIQSQISIWLISVFGSTHQVADIGSSVRLSVLYSTLIGSYATIMVPRFARNNGRRQLFMQAFQIIGSATAMLAAVVALTWIFPQPFIFLLGAKYANMTGLIWLVVLSQGIYSLAGMVYGLSLSKGWIPPAYFTIPVEIVTQIILLVTLDLSKTQNVLIFTTFGTIPPTLVVLWLLMRRLREEPE